MAFLNNNLSRWGYCLAFLFIIFLGSAIPAHALMESYFPLEHSLSLPNFPSIEDTKLEQFIDEYQHLYVLNVNAKMLYKMSLQGEVLGEYRLPLPDGFLATEANLWVRKNLIYIKFPDEMMVWRFSSNGELDRKIILRYPGSGGRLTGLTVDPRGYFYVLESLKGRVEVFEPDGHYAGCFAKVGSRDNDMRGLPQFLYMDTEGNLHVTVRLSGNDLGEIDKYNYQGRLEQRFFSDTQRYCSKMTVDKLGNVFAIEPSSLSVVKFDRRGRMICRFKTRNIRSLAVDSAGIIYIENASSGWVDKLMPSEIVRRVDQGNRAYLDDEWETAEKFYNDALRMDNQMDFIHMALGEVYYQQRRFTSAMREFKLIEDRWRYSQSLYGFRMFIFYNYWHYLAFFILVLLGLIIGFRKRLNPWFQHRFSWLSMIWSPRSSLLKVANQPNVFQSLSIILCFSIVSYIGWYVTNPIFIGDKQVFSWQQFGWRLFVIGLLTILWAWTGYKVGELFQGMAKNVKVFLSATALCLVPAIVLIPILSLASHLLTFEEIWIYQWAGRLLALWVIVLVVLKIRLTEDFTWGKAVGIGLLNIGATAMILCFLGFLVGINQQVLGFLNDLYREVYNRMWS